MNTGREMCVAMLIGFRPSQPPAAAPLCRGFRAAVPGPVPPSAVRPSRRAPQGPFRVTKVHMSVNKGEVGFYRDARFRVLGLGFSGCTRARDAPCQRFTL